ncbi:MAG: RluA family pseudouridine synthase [Clostridiales bacterium]|nr:RluA family pseudouridine synthase [Clostridiales bacterium]
MTTVYCTEGGARLDVFLSDETDISRSHIKKLIDGGSVLIGGVPAFKAGQIVKSGDLVSFEDEAETDGQIIPQDIPLDVLYEDNDIAVINKQRGLVVHPGAGNKSGTLVNALLYKYGSALSCAYGAVRAGIVHRLDKDTTGLMVIAKTDYAHASLGEQFANHTVKKFYHAVLDGNLKSDDGTVDAPIGRDKKNRLKMAVVPDGRKAVTKYQVLERFKNNCYVRFELCTGRTHQIRVHSAYLHHPVSCDPLYGGSALGTKGQLLHSAKLVFEHPRGGRNMEFNAPEPSDFLDILTKLRAKG